MSQSAHWGEAVQAWKEAERLYGELGERRIPIKDSQPIRLDDLNSRLAQFGPEDPIMKQLQFFRTALQYDYWLLRCKLEQSAEIQLVRKLSHEAAEYARQSNASKAYDLYRQSLQSLSQIHEQRPTQLETIAGEFKEVAAGYRKNSKEVPETNELASIMTLIEQSEPVSNLPLMIQPKRFHSSK